jgi:hypothetical protein
MVSTHGEAIRTDRTAVAAFLSSLLAGLGISVVMQGAERLQWRAEHLLAVVADTMDVMYHGRRDGLAFTLTRRAQREPPEVLAPGAPPFAGGTDAVLFTFCHDLRHR